MKREYLLTSESVSEGHPDKIADQISDAVLDGYLVENPLTRVACETIVGKGLIIVTGEVTSNSHIQIPLIAHCVLNEIYRGSPPSLLSPHSWEWGVMTSIKRQSSEIQKSINLKDNELCAGDQATVFGYATNETPELMPLGISLAHKLMQKQAELRKKGRLDWLGADGKTQVTVRYAGAKPVAVERVVFSTQHYPDVEHKEIEEAVISEIIEKVIPEELRAPDIEYLVNPGGRFVIGGPDADTGLTGRKIMVDTYGPSCPHGGGAFSGKDPTKIDRSGAYMARYIAKNIVAAGLAERCTVQLSYAIGRAQPLYLALNLHDTGRVDEGKLTEAVRQIFRLTPGGIIEMLNLRRSIYLETAAYGHFGRELPNFTWERRDKVVELKNYFDIPLDETEKNNHSGALPGADSDNSPVPEIRPARIYPCLVTQTDNAAYGWMPITYDWTPVMFVPNDKIKPEKDELTIVLKKPYKDGKLTESARKEVVTIASWLAGKKGLRTCAVFDEKDCVFCEPDGSMEQSDTPPSQDILME